MKIARLLSVLVVLGTSAIAARAQTDALIRIDDPLCTVGPNCVVLEYTGPTVTLPNAGPPADLFFVLPVTNPPGVVPDPTPPSNINCGGDVFSTAIPITNAGATEFFGCLFTGGTLTNDELYSFSDVGATSNIPFTVSNTLWKCAPGDSCSQADITISFSPEPSTSVLFMTGLLLFLLSGLARKRFGAASRS
jgi:hypothetical protein